MTDMSNGPELELTDAELEAIEKRAEACFIGPWVAHTWEVECPGHEDGEDSNCGEPHNMETVLSPDYPGEQVVAQVDHETGAISTPGLACFAKPHADFIAHARTDVPTLIRALRKERERVASLEASLQHARDAGPVMWTCDACGFSCDIGTEPLRAQLGEGAVEAIARAERAEARVAELEADVHALRSRTECSGREVDLTDPNDACQSAKFWKAEHDALRQEANAGADELTAQRDRAEAACARMRAALETARSVIGHVCKVEWSSEMRCFACLYDTALATDIGSGWVSPTEAEELRRRIAELEASR